ncbi:MAG: bifunctional phosphopantothenoylcysteine decarboxylase/phosphopantothenate--cysteine ligase CoaBC, partial [Rikenellaceae bacterium]|nr:bifunctional phosphopantothenoylcysteine decarboxylase/phosphopantothenate--cysteine ligase CoaBC [Rikenellaceae bacterium]
WNSHVSLGEWADAYLIAPATANTMAKMAHGVADNLLLTTYLSARCPVFIAPAMDLDMYAHAATQANLVLLRERGVQVVEPGEGELASGLMGKGRMAEPEQIVAALEAWFGDGTGSAKSSIRVPEGTKKKVLQGKRLMVTAGPTVEAIDPVRYISNHSTGKMGYAIVAELAARGAAVTLVSGPTALPVPAGVTRVDVRSAEEMYRTAVEVFAAADGAVMCAAVADYTPAEVSERKIKKAAGDMNIALKPTPDVAAELGRVKGARVLVGFALETDNELDNARGKMERKNLDMIVLNSLRDAGAGFGGDTNKIMILGRDGSVDAYPLESKVGAAARVVDALEKYLIK